MRSKLSPMLKGDEKGCLSSFLLQSTVFFFKVQFQCAEIKLIYEWIDFVSYIRLQH